SVHCGAHEREIVDFVKNHLKELNRIKTAFLSVSLSEASREARKAPAGQRGPAGVEVRERIDAFLNATGWMPSRTLPVAGVLLFTKYLLPMRFLMRRLARWAGR